MPNALTSSAPTLTDLLFEKAGVGLCLVAPDGTVVRANAEWLRSTGFSEGVVGEDIIELFPATRDMALAMHARARAGHRVEVPRHAQVVNGRDTWWEGSIEPVPMEGGTGLLITAREAPTTGHDRPGPAPDAPTIDLRDGARDARALETDAILGSIADGVLVYDSRGVIVRSNPAAREMLNLPEEVGRLPVGERVPRHYRIWSEEGRLLGPEEVPALRALRGETVRDEAVKVQSGTDAPKWMRISASPLRIAGREVGAVLSMTDVTERRRAEEALRESEEKLRTATTAANIGVWSWIPGTSEVSVSSIWRQLFGVDADERITFETWRAALHPDDRERAVRELNEAAAAHRDFNTEYRVLRPDGTFRWIVDRGRASYDGDGRAVVMGGVNVDITERKRTEEELAVVTRLYGVLSRVNEAIVRTNDERLLFAELCRIVAGSAFRLVWVGLVEGRAVVPVASAGTAVEYVRDLSVELDGPLGLGPTGTCIREDRPVINDDFALNPATWPWRDATARHGLRASAAFPLHRDGKAIGAVTFYAGHAGAFSPEQVRLLESLCADVSYALDAMEQERLRAEAERALRRSEEALREADRHKDEFLGMLSHELRNPLAPIRNSSYVLRHAIPGSEQATRAQRVIERQTEHLTRLVDDLLDLTRVARGKIELRRSRVDLREVVSRAAEDFRSVLRDRSVAFEVLIPEGKLWADADPTRITQVIGNLLHNASKFTGPGDTVTIAADVASGAAEIRVRDTGAGIDPALLPRIFDPFVQGERTLARTEGGLGLGLALVKAIAELHGGSVRVESAGSGMGAEFVVALPLVRDEATTGGGVAGDARPSGTRRVLVVDDNTDAAQSLGDVLTMLGHAVDLAYDGPSAVAKVRANPPDVVLCDLGLPGMTGYDVARALRSVASGVRLIAVSGYAQPEDIRRAVAAGFDGHVAKPADPAEIDRLLTG